MIFELGVTLIYGMALGIEYVPEDGELDHGIVVDLLFVRLLFLWYKEE